MQPNYRRCVSCRRLAPKQALWRIVRVYPTQAIALDQGSGRSAYLCPCHDCLRLAQKKNRLAKALKTAVPETIYAALWQRLSPPTTAVAPETARSSACSDHPV